jgi:hypothetical protein
MQLAHRNRPRPTLKFSDDLPDAFSSDESDPDLAEELDRDFPLGDGTADTNAMVVCPYCGEGVDIALDPGSGATQEYVEDCEVCCQPWRVSVAYDDAGQAHVSVAALDA